MRDNLRQMQEFLNPMGKTLASIIQENTLLTNYKFNIYKGFLDFANSVQQTLIILPVYSSGVYVQP